MGKGVVIAETCELIVDAFHDSDLTHFPPDLDLFGMRRDKNICVIACYQTLLVAAEVDGSG